MTDSIRVLHLLVEYLISPIIRTWLQIYSFILLFFFAKNHTWENWSLVGGERRKSRSFKSWCIRTVVRIGGAWAWAKGAAESRSADAEGGRHLFGLVLAVLEATCTGSGEGPGGLAREFISTCNIVSAGKWIPVSQWPHWNAQNLFIKWDHQGLMTWVIIINDMSDY